MTVMVFTYIWGMWGHEKWKQRRSHSTEVVGPGLENLGVDP